MARYEVVVTNGRVDQLVTVEASSAREAGKLATNPNPRIGRASFGLFDVKSVRKLDSGRVKRRASIPAHIERVIAEARADA